MKMAARLALVPGFVLGLAIAGAIAAGPNLGTITGYIITVQSKTGAYTVNGALGGPDCGTELRVTSSSAVSITLPNNGAVGCAVSVVQGGTAKVSFLAASGATLQSPHAFTGTYQQYSTIAAQVITNANGSTAVWIFQGDGS